MRVVILVIGVSCAATLLGGCASNREAGVVSESLTTEQEWEGQLRAVVDSSVERAQRNQGVESARLLKSKPYFYKEYWMYPDEDPVYSADFTEKESLSIPLTAEVELERTRFVTRVHRDKGEARDDVNYLRSTGIEQSSYELRHGEWRRVGSLFLAQRTEEFRNDEWTQVEERREVNVIDEEEPGGFWQKLQFWR